LGRFAITSPVTYGGDKVKLAFVNSFLKKNKVIGTKISREDYPNADPDAIGKVERIIYGQVKNVRCLPVVAGACTTLFTIGQDPRLNHRFAVAKGVLAARS
jgi:hypothetical protein